MFAFSFQSCYEPCLLCKTVQVRYTAMLHLFRPLCSFVNKSCVHEHMHAVHVCLYASL